MEKIVAVAIRATDRQYMWVRYAPFRHGDVNETMMAYGESLTERLNGEQGFIARHDGERGSANERFVNRIEARRIATAANQIIYPERSYSKTELFSENLW